MNFQNKTCSCPVGVIRKHAPQLFLGCRLLWQQNSLSSYILWQCSHCTVGGIRHSLFYFYKCTCT